MSAEEGVTNGREHFRQGVGADVVVRLGNMLMRSGTSGYRVIRGMKRAARALGFDGVDAEVGVTSITCTIHQGRSFRTLVVFQDEPEIDASRIEALEALTHNLHKRVTPEWLDEQLDFIEAGVRKRWSPMVLALAAGLACSGFAYLNNFSWLSIAVVFLSAAIGQVVRWTAAKHRVHALGAVGLAGIAAVLAYWAIMNGLRLIDGVWPLWDGEYLGTTMPGYVASVLFLIPGFPLFSSMIDLARFDITAGLARLTYACTIIFTATLSAAITVSIIGLERPELPSVEHNLHWLLISVAASFMGVAGFAFIFNSSRRMVLGAATIGMIANTVRLSSIELGLSPYSAALLGGLIAGLLGAWFSQRARIPRITTTVPASVIMIPGTSMFGAMFAIMDGDMLAMLSGLTRSGMQVAAISAGLVAARMMTDSAWRRREHINFESGRSWHLPGTVWEPGEKL